MVEKTELILFLICFCILFDAASAYPKNKWQRYVWGRQVYRRMKLENSGITCSTQTHRSCKRIHSRCIIRRKRETFTEEVPAAGILSDLSDTTESSRSFHNLSRRSLEFRRRITRSRPRVNCLICQTLTCF
ncbi:uncharacterized protein LOC143465720 [Clavelina lepadiformis]|uniref:Uncharacterized protein n=1 Tax=Clavelina lepadiformis TaxID=159417 RepID=A0ABP0EYK2_CLALP